MMNQVRSLLSDIPDLLRDANKIIVGVSGGVDSMVLLDILHRLRGKHVGEFTVLHVNHNINPDSAAWARFVSGYCADRNIPCIIESVDVSLYGNNLENAARQARYEAFAKQKADHIVLAHHADDQCETFFLKLLRGSGLKGLRCMSKSSPSWFDPNVKLVRPLLETNKEWIRQYANDHAVPSIEDISNEDVRFDRNWIRHDLWPMIVERNDIADINLLRSISLISEAWDLTQDLALIDHKACENADGTLDWYALRKMSMPRLKNLVVHLLDQNNISGFSAHHIEEFARSLINADLDSRAELRVKNFKMRKVGKRVLYGIEN